MIALLEISTTAENGIVQKIGTIDLTMVKLKLMDPKEGQGWSREKTDRTEILYKRYLTMLAVCQNFSPVPTEDIDLFWHQHILDTRAYAADCDRVFGRFIHHFPYFGMRGKEDARNLQSAFEQTKTAYTQLFGEDYAKSSKCHRCGQTCKTCNAGCGGVSCKTCQSK